MSAKWWKTRRSETPARRATVFAVGSVSPARSSSMRASATLRRVRWPRATRPSRAGSSSATSAARSSGACASSGSGVGGRVGATMALPVARLAGPRRGASVHSVPLPLSGENPTGGGDLRNAPIHGRPAAAGSGLQGLQTERLHNGRTTIRPAAANDVPGLERHRLVAAGRLVGTVGDDQDAPLAGRRRARSRAPRRPGPGRARWSARRAPGPAPAPAGRGPPPVVGARRRTRRRRPRPPGSRGPRAVRPPSPSRRAARNASAISCSPASGRPRTRLDRTVPANNCARWSASAQAARASAWRSCSTSAPPSDKVPASSGQNRRSAVTRLDLPAPLEPVTATRRARPGRRGSRRRGRGGGRRRSAGRRRRRPPRARQPVGTDGWAGSVTGTGTSSSAKRRSAAARTSSERATASGTPGHRFEGGEGGERKHGHHDLAEMMVVHGGRRRRRAPRSPRPRGTPA